MLKSERKRGKGGKQACDFQKREALEKVSDVDTFLSVLPLPPSFLVFLLNYVRRSLPPRFSIQARICEVSKVLILDSLFPCSTLPRGLVDRRSWQNSAIAHCESAAVRPLSTRTIELHLMTLPLLEEVRAFETLELFATINSIATSLFCDCEYETITIGLEKTRQSTELSEYSTERRLEAILLLRFCSTRETSMSFLSWEGYIREKRLSYKIVEQ